MSGSETLRCDAVVIGSGAGGAPAALALGWVVGVSQSDGLGRRPGVAPR